MIMSDFTPAYGYVAFNCGDACGTYTVDYYGSYGDDYSYDCECYDAEGNCGYYGESTGGDPYGGYGYGDYYYGDYGYGSTAECIAYPSDGGDDYYGYGGDDYYGVDDYYGDYYGDYDGDYYGDYYYYYSAEKKMDKKSKKAKKAKKLRQSEGEDLNPFTSAINFWGLDDIGTSDPVYCDHYHLYTFNYLSAEPVSSDDSADDLWLYGISMIGFPGACSFDWTFGIHSDLELGTEYATTGD